MEDYGVAKGYIELDISSLKSSAVMAVQELRNIDTAGELAQSELRKLQAESTGVSNAFEKAAAKSKTLTQQIDTAKQKTSVYKKEIQNLNGFITKSKDEQEKLGIKIQQVSEKYDKSKSKVDSLSEAYKAAQKEIRSVTKEYGENSTQAEEAASKNKSVIDAYSKAQSSTEKYRNELLQLQNQQDSLVIATEDSGQKIKEFQTKINNAETSISLMSRELEEANNKAVIFGQKAQETGEKWQNAGRKMGDIGSKLTMGVTLPLTAAGAYAVKTAVDFESAFIGVEKTVDGTAEQMDKLRQGIIDMSKEIPTSATEISAVAESAGQLGIQTDNVLGFTKTIIDLGNATNLTNETAASSLAKYANVTKMSQGDFDRLGSVIVDLGNKFATTESDIVSMGTRLSGAGSQIGLTNGEIMGFSTALSSVGIEAEMGGSAFSKAMIKMQVACETGLKPVQQISEQTGLSLRDLQLMSANASKDFSDLAQSLGLTKDELNNMVTAGANLESFAEIAGMTSEQFKQAFEQDAAGAIELFIKGLGDTESKGESTIAMLEEMGFTEVRLRDTMTRLANSGDLVTRAVDTGNKAWEENTALTKEAEKRYGSTASQMQISKNKIVDSARIIGEKMVPAVADLAESAAKLAEKFADLDPETQKMMLGMLAASAAAGPLIKGIGGVTQITGGAIRGAGRLSEILGKKGIAKAAGEATGGLGGLSPVVSALMTPVGGLVALAGGAVGVMALLNEQTKSRIEEIGKLTPEEQALSDTIEQQNKVYQNVKESSDAAMESADNEAVRLRNLSDELGTLVDANGQVTAGNEARAQYIMGELSSALGIEFDMTDGLINNYQELQEQIRGTIEMQRAQAVLAANEEKYQTALAEKDALQKSYNESQKNVLKTTRDLEAAQKEFNEVGEKYNNGMGLGVAQQELYAMAQQNAAEKVAGFEEKLKKQTKELKEAETAFVDYNSTTANYEGLSSAINSGEVDQIKSALTMIENSFITAETGTRESLERQKDSVREKYKEMQEDLKKGVPGVTQEAVDGIKNLVDRADEELEAKITADKDRLKGIFQQCGIEATDGLLETLSKKSPEAQAAVIDLLDKVSSGTTLRKEELKTLFEECGISATGSLIKSLTDKKPEVQMEAVDLLNKLNDGVVLKQPEIQQLLTDCGISVSDSLISSIDGKKPEAQSKIIEYLSEINNGTALKQPELVEILNQCGIASSDSLIQALEASKAGTQIKAIELLTELQNAEASKRPEICAQLNSLGINVDSSLSSGIDGNVGAVTGSMTGSINAGFTAANTEIGNQQPGFNARMNQSGAEGRKNFEKPINETNVVPPDMDDPDWTSQAWNGRGGMQGILDSNPLTAWINVFTRNMGESPGKKANGGFTSKEHLTWISENDKPEVVIPLSPERRSRAMSLLRQTQGILGVDAVDYDARRELFNNFSMSSAIQKSDEFKVFVQSPEIDYKLLSDMIADKLSDRIDESLRKAPIRPNVVVEMEDGDVYLDNEKVGRKQAPVISRIQAKR